MKNLATDEKYFDFVIGTIKSEIHCKRHIESNIEQFQVTVKPLFERHLYLKGTSNRTELWGKG